MQVNAIAVILFGLTGFVVALMSGALITGTALSFGGPGAGFRFVRQDDHPRAYWATVILHASFLAFMTWIDVTGLAPHP